MTCFIWCNIFFHNIGEERQNELVGFCLFQRRRITCHAGWASIATLPGTHFNILLASCVATDLLPTQTFLPVISFATWGE
jgi:hypothetical protein